MMGHALRRGMDGFTVQPEFWVGGFLLVCYEGKGNIEIWFEVVKVNVGVSRLVLFSFPSNFFLVETLWRYYNEKLMFEAVHL